MCTIAAIPLLTAGLSIVQAGAGYSASVQQANAQNAAWEQNRVNAVKAQEDQYASLASQNRQQRESASQNLQQKQVDALKAQATARVAGGESGVAGLSTNALLGDYAGQFGRQADAIDTNYEYQRDHTADELVATRNQTISRINSMQRAGKVSAAPFVFQALGGVLGAATTGLKMQNYGGVDVDNG